MENKIKFWYLLNETLKENKTKLRKYEQSSASILQMIKEIFQEKIQTKCRNQMENFYKNCLVEKNIKKTLEIKNQSGKESECKE